MGFRNSSSGKPMHHEGILWGVSSPATSVLRGFRRQSIRGKSDLSGYDWSSAEREGSAKTPNAMLLPGNLLVAVAVRTIDSTSAPAHSA